MKCKILSACGAIYSIFLQFAVLIPTVNTIKRCEYDLSVLWTRELGHSPFAAAPLIADINADGQLDVIAAPFLDEVTVLRGEDGSTLAGTKWPYTFVDVSTHSSPLMYDINGDGTNDIVITTSDGLLLFFKYDGTPYTNYTYQFPGLQVREEWYKTLVNADTINIHDEILDAAPKGNKTADGYVAVDPHVLATPVIADFNGDGRLEEMIVPVSYYFDPDQYSDAEYLPVRISEMYNYLASTLFVFNFSSLQPANTLHLELTVVKSEFPGYLLNSPTLIDLDGNGSDLEIVIGTSGGHIHALHSDGTPCKGFPITTDSIHGQVLVADVNLDGKLEIVAMDTSSNVLCYDTSGQVVWESNVSGTSSSGARLADVNQDGALELVIASDDGKLWVLSGSDGKPVSGWPLRVGKSHHALPLVTQFDGQGSLDFIVTSDDENLHIVSGDSKCRNNVINLGETSVVPILSHDLVKSSPGLEILIATSDGTLMCLGRPPESSFLFSDMPLATYTALQSLPAEMRSYNDFYASGISAVVIGRDEEGVIDIIGGGMYLSYQLIDDLSQPEIGSKISHRYTVRVYYGKELLAQDSLLSPGEYSVHVPAPTKPSHGHLTLQVTNQFGRLLQDQIAVRFNMLFLQDLPWLLLCPFVAMAIILLLLHGYPAADLLPVTMREKGR